MALCSGASLYIRAQEALLAGDALLKFAAQHSITHLSIPVAVLATLPESANLESVRCLIAGGEKLPRSLVEHWAPGRHFFNAYGPTETTVCATAYRCSVEANANPPIGRPIANTQIYILDNQRQPVPIGVAGEIYIGGVGVARGYLNRPELTAEQFLSDPFVRPGSTSTTSSPTVSEPNPNPRMYRTGDIGRWLADGNIEYLGRNDFQVKIRGFRIELGEIEAKLASIAGIKETVVLAREDVPGEKRLVAYYTGSDEVTAGFLRSRLAKELPEYMVPAAYVRLEALPLTPNGKLDRKALPAPQGDAFNAKVYEEPVGEVERTLAQIWCKVLGTERVGRKDNFFELGGHSLTAVQLVDMLKQAGFELPIARLFTNPTIERLAVCLAAEKTPLLGQDVTPIRVTGGALPLFLVHEVSGEVFYGFNLARHMDTDISVYGLPCCPPPERPARTLHAQARRLVQIIRSVQQSGPYRIAGWSYGGTLAYEIAAQLIGEEQTVAFLGLLDTHSFNVYETSALTDEKTLLLRLVSPAIDINSSLMGQLETLAATVDFETLAKRCQDTGLIPARLSVESIRHLLTNYRINESASLDYHRQPIPIAIHLFRAIEQPDTQDSSLGWTNILPKEQVQVIPVPGTHKTIVESPHVEKLGELLSAVVKKASAAKTSNFVHDYDPLVTIQAGQRDRTPVFCVPGAGANITVFTDLAAVMGLEWPIYGLQPRGLDGASVPHSTVAAAAQVYLRAISKAYPAGPVHLLGHSFGGWVAFEMALQLCAAGRDVGSVTVIDSDPPGKSKEDAPAREYNRTEIFLELVSLLEQSSGCSLGVVADDLISLDRPAQLKLVHERLMAAGIMPHQSTPDALNGMVRTFAANLQTSYLPSATFPGAVRLVLVPDSKEDEATFQMHYEQTTIGWRRWAPGLVAWRGRGNHMTILKSPLVTALADWLRRYLRSTELKAG
jgi:thioesterase domain-containing protein/aryl carrier-like protein